MPRRITDAREIAALVPMPRLLGELGFIVNERTRGDRIELVRDAKQCSFREGVQFLAALAGAEFRPGQTSRISLAKRAEAARLKESAERKAWRTADEIARLRRYYTDGLHRCERLQARIGDELLHATSEGAREKVWETRERYKCCCHGIRSGEYVGFAFE